MFNHKLTRLKAPALVLLLSALAHAGPVTFSYAVSGPTSLPTNGPPGLVRSGTYTVDQDALANAVNGTSNVTVPVISFTITTYYSGVGVLNYSGPADPSSGLIFPNGGGGSFTVALLLPGGDGIVFIDVHDANGKSTGCLSGPCSEISSPFGINTVLGQFQGKYSQFPAAPPAVVSNCTSAAAPATILAMNLERALPLANVLTTITPNAPPSTLAALAGGALEIREILTYTPGSLASTVFLVAPGSPLPSPAGTANAQNTVQATAISLSRLQFSCSPVPSLLLVGTVSGNTGNLYGNLNGAVASLSLNYTSDAPPKFTNVTETLAGVATAYSIAASGTLTLPAGSSGGGGGAGPKIVVKFANGAVAVPGTNTQAQGSPFFLDASGSSSSGGALTFTWSTTSNSPVAFVGTGVPGQILVQLPGTGAYVIQLKVTDASGASATFTLTLEYTGRPN